ncbi:MAG TPA: hypothetical protein VKV96_20515 [Roseiarcus sp.]|nr:hypothetical protein [Roseiarcus sp.]
MPASLRDFLTSWDPTQPLPPEVKAGLPAAIEAASASIAPVDEKRLAVAIDETFSLLKLPAHWPKIARFYLEALADVPADLVAEALKSIRLSHRGYYDFPQPADLRAPIEKALSERRNLRAKMIAAERLSRLQSAPESTEELNEEQRQKIAERFRALAISLNYTPPPKEVAPEPPQHAHDPYRIDRVLHETARFKLRSPDDPDVAAEIARIEAESAKS